MIKGLIPKIRYKVKKLIGLFQSQSNALPFRRRFVVVEDGIAHKPFQVYVREDSMIEDRVISKGLYRDWERESLKIWAHLSGISQTIIDIGANTGIYSLIAQNNNLSAKVVAIEPVEINFDVLQKNIHQNNFSIHAEQIALSDKDGSARMFMLKDQLNYMTSINDNRYDLHPEIKGKSEVEEIEITIRPFSFVFDKYQLQGIDLVKIDVEGHEITVLRAMLPYIKKWKPVLLVEIIGDENAEILNGMFTDLDYRFVSINETRKSVVATRLWDNDHHNFLICHDETISFLRGKGLVV
jgi:FkbM family methyltransferase